MGQCLSQPAEAQHASGNGGQASGKTEVGDLVLVGKEDTQQFHLTEFQQGKPEIGRPVKASPPPDVQPSQQQAAAPALGAAYSKCSDAQAFPSCASDATSAQPSAGRITIESSGARDTPTQATRACHVSTRHLQTCSSESRQPAASVSAQQHERPASLSSLSVLSTCVSGAAALPRCQRSNLQQAGGGGKEEQAGGTVDAEEMVINPGGCCGPVLQKELAVEAQPNLSIFTSQAHENGLAGLPHDLVKYGAPHPPNEDARMATVRALRNMGMQECPELDLILKVICRIWQAPAACVTLLDSDHVFICSADGGFQPCHRPWAIAMCPWMLLSPNPAAMAINDLSADARFAKSAHVSAGTRSYLTAPLVASNGHRLGAICFTDVKPRMFDAGDCRLMNNCAELAIRAIESHLKVRKRLGLPSMGAKGRSKPLARLRGGTGPGSGGDSGGGGRGADLDTDDGTLMEEFASRVRDVSVGEEAVVLLLDTRAPGWTVLYASAAWEELTGVDRAEAVGAALNDVMAHVSGDPRVVWEGVEREAAAGKAFVTPRVYLKSSPATTFYLSFRPGASADLDDQTVTLGVPATVPQATSAATSRLYFARLHTTPDPPPNTTSQSAAPSAILTTGRRLPPSIAINPVQGLTEMFQGLVVGQVLGQGSYGTVYHARWHGVDVAIKVQDMHIRNAEERLRAEFEVGLGQRLHHLNVVHTLSHSSALLERSNSSTGVIDSCGSNAWHAGLQFAPLGFAMASRSSGLRGRGSAAAGRDSTTPDSVEGLGFVMGDAPSFIPFYMGGGSDAAAAAVAAAAAAAAAAATGSIGGAAARDQPSLVDIAETAGLAALGVGNGSSAGGVGGYVDGPSYAAPVSSVNTGTTGPAAPPSGLALVSGSSGSALVRVALPSGAHVPMLRNPARPGAAVAGAAAVLAAAAGGGSGMPPLAALQFAHGSSRSSSPRYPVTPGSVAPDSQGSNVIVTAAVAGGGVIGGSLSGGVNVGGGSDDSSGLQLMARKPSFSRFADEAAAVAAAAKLEAANGSGGGADGNGQGGTTLVPFLSADGLAAALAYGGGGDVDSVLATIGGFVANGGGGAAAAAAAATTGSNAAAAASMSDAADGSSLAPGAFGSTLHCSSGTRLSAANTTTAGGGGGTSISAAQNLASLTMPLLPEAKTTQPLCGTDAEARGSQPDEQQQPAPAPQSPPRPQSPSMQQQEQQQQEVEQQEQHSGALALSCGGPTYNGMPLLPYIDGAAVAAGFEGMATAPAGGGDGEDCVTAAGIATTMQGAIEADLTGLSYPLDVRLWMVLEFMDKGSLQDAIDRGWLREGRTTDHGPDYPAVLATAREIATAVAYLHSHDVVHGDLSAVNVLLQSVRRRGDDDGSKRGGEPLDFSGRGFVAKISDFGLSMQLKQPNQAIKTGAYGTITHMAPEVLRDSRLSKAADVYSVGVLLWQMVTGSRPWAGLSHLQVSVEVGSHLRQLVWPPWVHAAVRALGQRCMAGQPSERPTAAQLAAELAELLAQVPQYG